MVDEYIGKCSVCNKNCHELFDSKCDTCFLDEQYFGGGMVLAYDPNPGGDDF